MSTQLHLEAGKQIYSNSYHKKAFVDILLSDKLGSEYEKDCSDLRSAFYNERKPTHHECVTIPIVCIPSNYSFSKRMK